MPEIYKRIFLFGFIGLLMAFGSVAMPPTAPPPVLAAEELAVAPPADLLDALPALITDTLSITGEVQSEPDTARSFNTASVVPDAPRSFAVAADSPTPTTVPPQPTPAKPLPTPTKKPVAPVPAPVAASCGTIAGQAYGALNIRGGPTDRPAASQADLNLGLRGWVQVNQPLGLINMGGPTDDRSPRFQGLFGPSRMPRITAAYQVYNWNFGAGRRTSPVTDPPVTLLGFATAPGEIIRVPNAAYDIGNGYAALVLYAEPSRITLKYTREDNVAVGYTLHLESICVEPRLLALYRSLNAGGRRQLPALRNGQPLGIATGGQIITGIQDSGTWMDPRSRKDWW